MQSTIDIQLAAHMLRSESGPILLDVRDPQRYELLHALDAINLHLPDVQFSSQTFRHVLGDDRTRAILVLADSDQRGKAACELVNEAGYENLHLIQNGWSGWLAANLPTVGQPETQATTIGTNPAQVTVLGLIGLALIASMLTCVFASNPIIVNSAATAGCALIAVGVFWLLRGNSSIATEHC